LEPLEKAIANCQLQPIANCQLAIPLTAGWNHWKGQYWLQELPVSICTFTQVKVNWWPFAYVSVLKNAMLYSSLFDQLI